MKKTLLFVLLIGFLFIIIPSCSEDPDPDPVAEVDDPNAKDDDSDKDDGSDDSDGDGDGGDSGDGGDGDGGDGGDGDGGDSGDGGDGDGDGGDGDGDGETSSGIITVETETAELSGDWEKRTVIDGYTGEGYIVWEGPNQFWKGEANIGKAGLLTYKINVTKPGTYLFQWRSYIAKKDPAKPTTEHNDSWLRIPDADDFFATKGSSTLYPKGSGKSPNPAGENGNGFFKIYMNTIDKWTMISSTSDNDAHQIFATFNEKGEYTVEIAARSDWHAIDSFTLKLQE